MTTTAEPELNDAEVENLLVPRPGWMKRTNYIVGPIIKMQVNKAWFASLADEAVKSCGHEVWESVLLAPPANTKVEEIVRCYFCHAPRCSGPAERDPCMLVHHHRGGHHFLSGAKGG